MAYLLWMATRGGQCSLMMKQGLTAWSMEREISSPDPVLNVVVKCMEKVQEKYNNYCFNIAIERIWKFIMSNK